MKELDGEMKEAIELNLRSLRFRPSLSISRGRWASGGLSLRLGILPVCCCFLG